MIRKIVFMIVIFIFSISFIYAEDHQELQNRIKLLQDELITLRTELKAYKEKYQKIDNLFITIYYAFRDFAAKIGEHIDDAKSFTKGALKFSTEVDKSIDKVQKFVEYVKLIKPRPTMYIDVFLQYRDGTEFGSHFLYSPFSWLSIYSGVDITTKDDLKAFLKLGAAYRFNLN